MSLRQLCQLKNVFKNKYAFPRVFVRSRHVWSTDKVVRSPFLDVSVPEVTLNEYVWKILDKHPTKTAAVCGITNRSYTYEQMYKQSQVFGANLRKKFNIQDGDSVGIMLSNLPEYPTIFFGVLSSGGMVTTYNPIYTAYLDILKEVKAKADDVCVLPYSSGTTGLPKGVEIMHRNIIANCEQQNTECKIHTDTTDSNQESLLIILPMYHSYGLSILMLHKLSVGLKLVTLPRFQPDTFLNALLEYKINLLYTAPPLILFLGSHPQATAKHLEHLRVAVCGAAPLPTADMHKVMSKVKHDIHFGQGYGMTEASPLVSVAPIGCKAYETVGYAIPNIQLRVVDQDLNNLGPGQVGELLIKGPNIMKGYRNNPEANKEVFLEGDWLRSGDLAKIDEVGLISIADRLKELIKVNAYQVPPAELESAVKDHPAVFDAAVVGIADPNTGERPKAFVMLNDGAKATDEDIMKFVNERVAPYKRIKEVEFVDSIPKNPSGKILRRVLKEQYCKK